MLTITREKKRILYNADSPEDIYQAAEQLTPEGNKREWVDCFYNLDTEWVGATKAEIYTRRNGWDEAAREIAALPDFSTPARCAKSVKVWNDEDGDDGDYERYKSELPFLHRRKKITGGGQSRIVKILTSVSEHSAVKWQSMKWKTISACKIADSFESAGMRTEIIGFSASYNAFHGGEDSELFYTIKKAEEPLNIGLVANCLSPWFFRCIVFAMYSATANVTSGKGSPKKYPHPIEQNEILIDRGECLSRSAYLEFIKKVNAA